jgi:hypothetical protein
MTPVPEILLPHSSSAEAVPMFVRAAVVFWVFFEVI